MDISLINSQSLLRLLSLAERKEELLNLVEEIDAAIIGALRQGVSVEVVEVTPSPAIAATPAAVSKAGAAAGAPAKQPKAKRKGRISPEGRAKIAAAAKARWAKLRAGKAAAKPASSAKKAAKPDKKGSKLRKGFKLPKPE